MIRIICQYLLMGKMYFLRWKRRCESMSKSDNPNTIASYLKACDNDIYPNLCMLLKIYATSLVTFNYLSLLKCLNTYSRVSMRQTLLCAVWKVSVFGVILVRIFSHLDWMRTKITPNMETFYAACALTLVLYEDWHW